MEKLPDHHYKSQESSQPVTPPPLKTSKDANLSGKNTSRLAREALDTPKKESKLKESLKAEPYKEHADKVSSAVSHSEVLGKWKSAKIEPEKAVPKMVIAALRKKEYASRQELNSRIDALLPAMTEEKELGLNLLQLHVGLNRIKEHDQKKLVLDKNNHFVVEKSKGEKTAESQAAYRHGISLIKEAANKGIFSIPLTRAEGGRQLYLSDLIEEIESAASPIDEKLKEEGKEALLALEQAKSQAVNEDPSRTIMIPERVKKELTEEYHSIEKEIFAELSELNEAIKQEKGSQKNEILRKAKEKLSERRDVQSAYLAQINKVENFEYDQIINHIEIHQNSFKDSKILKEEIEIKYKKLKKNFEKLFTEYDRLQATFDELALLQTKSDGLTKEIDSHRAKWEKAESKLKSESYNQLEDRIFSLNQDIQQSVNKEDLQTKKEELRRLTDEKKRIQGESQRSLAEMQNAQKILKHTENRIKVVFEEIRNIKTTIRELEKKLPRSKVNIRENYQELKTTLNRLQNNINSSVQLEEAKKTIKGFIKPDVDKAADESARQYHLLLCTVELPTKLPDLFSNPSKFLS